MTSSTLSTESASSEGQLKQQLKTVRDLHLKLLKTPNALDVIVDALSFGLTATHLDLLEKLKLQITSSLSGRSSAINIIFTEEVFRRVHGESFEMDCILSAILLSNTCSHFDLFYRLDMQVCMRLTEILSSRF